MNMNMFSEKIRGNGGFTLVEMLIVVAIIAILVAVSIPLVGTSLENAAHSADAANERSAKAAIVIEKMMDPNLPEGTSYFYDAVNGKILQGMSFDEAKAVTGTYGKHRASGNDACDHEDCLLMVGIKDGKVFMMWGYRADDTADLFQPTNNANLCSTSQSISH